MASNKGWFQGAYQVINKDKYIGKAMPIYRSSWEKRMMSFLDLNKNVLRWGSEIIEIPYHFVIDGKNHKYVTDIYCEIQNSNGEIKKYVLEIKPSDGLVKPNPPKINNKKAYRNYNYKLASFIRNKNKWQSAAKFCESRGWIFKILTEKELSF